MNLPTRIGRLESLLEEVQETVQQAEESEPLLASELYDAFRETQKRRISQNLQSVGELLKNGLREQALPIASSADEGIRQFRDDIETAAEGILGNELESLRWASSELNELSRQLDREISQNSPKTVRKVSKIRRTLLQVSGQVSRKMPPSRLHQTKVSHRRRRKETPGSSAISDSHNSRKVNRNRPNRLIIKIHRLHQIKTPVHQRADRPLARNGTAAETIRIDRGREIDLMTTGRKGVDVNSCDR